MVDALLKDLHVLSVIVWVGGMVFAVACLRPAALRLQPPERLPLLHDALGRFFTLVLVAAPLVLLTGLAMVLHAMIALAHRGQALQMPAKWWLMVVAGTLMVAIFGHIRFVLFRRFAAAVASAQWPAGGAAMNAIRQWVAVNLALGLLIVAAQYLP